MKITVRGAAGSVGLALLPALQAGGHNVRGSDIGDCDVRDYTQVARLLRDSRPDVVIHLAGAKHAPQGEVDPLEVAEVNIGGTTNVLRAAAYYDARVITASTCKACDPETAYGASKLIAERMTLNAGGSVARFYNVPESCGNVFRLWEEIPSSEPLPVMECSRYFISMAKVVDLLVHLLDLPAGRWTVDPGPARWMTDVAEELYPGREQVAHPARRGDRDVEPLCARSETLKYESGFVRIISKHDGAA